MKLSVRPTINRIILKPKGCYEKESNSGLKIPCLPDEMKSSLAGLYKRGLIETSMEIVDNKKQLCLYVSEAGKKFLQQLKSSDLK
jgi:hypothetical protein